MFGIDKMYHFFFYATAAFVLGHIACYLSPRARSRQRLLWVGVGLFLVGLLDEYRQFFDLTRDTEFLDAVYNLLGISLGLIFTILFRFSSIPKGEIHYFPLLVVLLLQLPLLYGLVFLTSKGPETTFFPNGEAKPNRLIVEVFQSKSTGSPGRYDALKQEYLPTLLEIEQDYRTEMSDLLHYARGGKHVFHYLWLMKQLDDAVDDEFHDVLVKMKRDLHSSEQSDPLLHLVEKEFMQRKSNQRAQLIKKTSIEVFSK